MNNVLKKALVIAMAAAMSLSVAMPAFAASTNATVNTKAMAYFDNYASSKYNLSADALMEKIEAGEDMYIIDIRDAVDYNANHIKGAVNIPYFNIDDKLEHIPNDKPVYVHCYSGQTASQTVALLRLSGVDAYNVSGGWNNISKLAETKAELFTTKARKVTYNKRREVNDSLEAAIKAYYDNAEGKYNISPAAVKAGVEDGSIFLLDVRSAADHKAGHIEGVGMNIPFGLDMQESFSKLPKGKKIAVQCYSGQTASQTVAILRMLGYDAWNMSGGTGAEGGSGWLGAGYELVK